MKKLGQILLPVCVFLSCLPAMAIPARQEIKTVVQPDGVELRIRVVGDENLHYSITEDGYILQQDSDGFYRLAEITPEGLTVSTGIRPETVNREQAVGTKITDIDFRGIREQRIRSGNAPISGLYENQSQKEATGVRRVAESNGPKILVFLVEYSDVKFSTDFDAKEYFTKMMTEDGFDMFGGTGSAMQYFREQSKGKFVPSFDVYGPVTLPENQAYYGSNYGQGWDMKAHYMVSHAAKALDSEVDFSQYDTDKDGDVDFVYVFYAGQGEHNKGGENTVWPHAGNLKQVADFVKLDGVWFDTYACSNEMEGEMPNGLGPFVHEYSHILGLPDLYASTDIVVDRDFTCGPYSVLDYGPYNNNSRTPPNYTAYERYLLKWDSPIILDHPMTVTLDNISTGDFGMIPTEDRNEYYLFENRQQVGWDAALPSHGMLIWHIDRNIRGQGIFVNPNRDNQSVNLVEANEMEAFLKYADGYTFPGTTGKTSFTSETSPALVTSAGDPIDMPVTGIKEENGQITFDVAGGAEEDINSGINIAEEDCYAPEYYNLQGLRILQPVPGAIVIEKVGTKTRKIKF